MKIIENVILDIRKDFAYKITAKQDDIDSRFLNMAILDNGQKVNLTDHTVKLYVKKPDDTIIFTNALITDAANGIVEIELTSQTLAIAGLLKCELVIYGTDTSVASSKIFFITVETSLRDDTAIESQNEFGALVDAMSELSEYENYKVKINENTAKIGPSALETTAQNLSEAVNELVYSDNTIQAQLVDVVQQASDLETNKAEKTDLNTTNANVALKANQSDLLTQKGRIDTLVQTASSSYYEKCLQTDTGALLVVESGATTGQIDLTTVTPLATGYTAVAGDYVRLVYGVSSGSTELIDARVGVNGIAYASVGESMRTQINEIPITFNKQYINNTATVTNSIYYLNDQLKVAINTSGTGYSGYSALKLPPGTYYVGSDYMADYTLIEKISDGTAVKLSTIINNGTFTIAYPFNFYGTVTTSTSTAIKRMLSNGMPPSSYVFGLYNIKIDGINTTSIADTVANPVKDGTITPKKTTFINGKQNILDISTGVSGYWSYNANSAPGAITTTSTSTTRYSAVTLKAGINYITTSLRQYFCIIYDTVTKTYTRLNSSDVTGMLKITPTNDSILYVTVNNTASANAMVIENDRILPPKYMGYGIMYDMKLANSVIYVGATRSITKLTDAIQNAQEGTKIYVDAGTYDIYEEMGGDSFFNSYVHSDGNYGLILQSNIEIIFSPNAKVVFNYTGTNSEVLQYFSPFNASATGGGGFKLIGLNLETSRCRYSIHDEHATDSVFYHNVYRNCTIKHDNSNNQTWTALQCIGGGLGTNGLIEIDNCIFESVGAENYGIVSYHNCISSSAKSKISVKNSYCKGTNTLRFASYGNSTNNTDCIVSGCSLGHSIMNGTETTDGTSPYANMIVTSWNNEIRS